MAVIQFKTVESNGINMHVAEAGEGPLVVLCHGFPESWYSWRHQLRFLSDQGFRVVAPDRCPSRDLRLHHLPPRRRHCRLGQRIGRRECGSGWT